MGRAHPARPPLPSVPTPESHGSRDASFCFPNDGASSGSAGRTRGHPSGVPPARRRGFTLIPPQDAQPPASLGDNQPCHQPCWGQRLRSVNSSARFSFSSGGFNPLGAAVRSGAGQRGRSHGLCKAHREPLGQEPLPSRRGQVQPGPSCFIPKAPTLGRARQGRGGGGGTLHACSACAGTQLASALPGDTSKTPGTPWGQPRRG